MTIISARCPSLGCVHGYGHEGPCGGFNQPEKVNHPAHYGGEHSVYEVIKVIDAWKLGFALGNTVKYIARAGRKEGSPSIEDLKKARWYLDHEIKKQEG